MKHLNKVLMIPFLLSLVPVSLGGLWITAETSVWNYLQKNKNKSLSDREEKIHNWLFGGKDEIVEFDASEFKEYEIYNRAYPNRFVVKYDENLNRIW